MNKKLWLTNIIVNSLIAALTIVGVFLMFFGDDGALSSARWEAFKYFTVQSNLFAAASAVISLVYLFKKNKEYPSWLTIFKLTSTVSVAITFFVVIIYLGPIYSYPLLYRNANLFFHAIVPALAMLQFALIEPKAKFSFKLNLFSLLPVSVYGTFYLINVAARNDYGNYKGADWYAFGTYGLGIGILCLLILIAFSFVISIGLYFLHQKTTIKKLHQ